MQNILLLEDDTALGNGIRLALQSDTVQVRLLRTLAKGTAAVLDTQFDLLILDINLPDGSGLALLRQVRQTSSVPIPWQVTADRPRSPCSISSIRRTQRRRLSRKLIFPSGQPMTPC